MNKKGTSHITNLPRIKRIEGQVKGIRKMVEEKRYCVDILTQIKAVRSALKGLENKILEEHLNHCVHKAVSSQNSKESKKVVEELLVLIRKASS